MLILTNFISATELITVFVTTLILITYGYYQYCFSYWKRKGVPQSNPKFPAGDITPSVIGKQSLFVRLEHLYKELKAKGYKHAGIYFFNGPIYFPIDPDLIKKVLVADFDYFVDRGTYFNSKQYPLTNHILSMRGDEWKKSRAKLTPTFTTGKMKSMFNIIKDKTRELLNTLEPCAINEEEPNIKDTLTRFTTDIIGSTAFGIECNSLKYPDTEFVRMVNKIFNHSGWQFLRVILEEGSGNPGVILKVTHRYKNIENFFTNLVKETVDYRDQNNVSRDDFLNILLQLRQTSNITFSEIVAQSYLFFTAGFETSSSTMSFCLHELTLNVPLQDQLRMEIHERLGTDSSTYTYDDIMTLPLLNRVVKETLRKYPPSAMINRICVKDYEIPGTGVTIQRGTPMIIALMGLHRDSDYWPEPLKFDPDRFNDKNEIVPFTYMPFGEGPRNCIGMRFGLMQVKMGLASLLCHYKFTRSLQTPEEIEFEPNTTTIVLKAKHPIYCKISKAI